MEYGAQGGPHNPQHTISATLPTCQVPSRATGDGPRCTGPMLQESDASWSVAAQRPATASFPQCADGSHGRHGGQASPLLPAVRHAQRYWACRLHALRCSTLARTARSPRTPSTCISSAAPQHLVLRPPTRCQRPALPTCTRRQRTLHPPATLCPDGRTFQVPARPAALRPPSLPTPFPAPCRPAPVRTCRYLVNMKGTRWPRCSASEEGP